MKTVFRKFPQEKQAFINPEDTTECNPTFPKLCVSTFSESIINKFASLEKVDIIGELYSANGVIPIYQIVYKNVPIAFL